MTNRIFKEFTDEENNLLEMQKNPAVIFISRRRKTIPEGLCIKCAMDMNLGPVNK